MTTTVAELVAAIRQEGAEVTIGQIDGVGAAGTRMGNDVNQGSLSGAEGMKVLGKQLLGVAAAFLSVTKAVEFLKSSSKVAAGFEQSVADLSAITGATGKDLEFLSDKSREFGAATTLSASQAAEAFKLVASAKPDLLESGEALAEVTKQAITLAEASGTSLPDAARTLGSALNQFQADAGETGRFINVLAAGAKFGASEIVETSAALKDAGTVASAAGVSFEELNAGVQALANVAIKGGQAGTSLRNIILKLQNQTQDGFNPAIVGLRQALANLNASQLDTVDLTRLFGLENATAAAALIRQADTVDELTHKLTGTNTAYEQAATKVNTLQGDVKTLNSAFEELQIQVGSDLNPSLRTLSQAATSVLRAWTETNKEFSDQTAISGITESVNDLALAAKGVQQAFVFAGNAVGASVAAMVTTVSGAVASVSAIMGFFTGETDDLGATLEAQGEKTAAALGAIWDGLQQKTVKVIDETATFSENLERVSENAVNARGALEQLGQVSQDFRGPAAFKQEVEQEVIVGQKLETGQKEKRSGLRVAEREELEKQAAIEREKREQEAATRKAAREAEALQRERDNLQRRAEMVNEFASSDEERERIAFERRLETLTIAREEAVISQERFNEIKEKLEQSHQDRLNNIVQVGLTDREKFEKASAVGKTKIIAGELSNITAGVAQHNKKLFKINKVAGIATATINAFQGASESLKAYPMPYAAVVAAAHLAAGFAQVNAIKSASFSGGGAGAAPSTAGGGGGGAGPPQDTIPRGGSDDDDGDGGNQQSSGLTINIIGDNYGNEDLQSSLVDALREADRQDVVVFTQNGRQADAIRSGSTDS